MDVEKLIECLEAYFPLSLQEGWDNSGLQVSPKEKFIKAILFSVDITLDVVEEANSKGCNLIIAHHPLIFSATKKIDRDIYPFNVLYRAIELGIGIFAFHTNLDIADGGINDCLCEKLGLLDVEKLEVKPVRVGKLRNPMAFDEFLGFVKNKIGVGFLKYVRANKNMVERVAVCGGSCMDILTDLRGYDFDVFVSSDLRHHQAVWAKETGISVVDATHFFTELCSKEILKRVVDSCGQGINSYLSESESLPWEYI